MRRRAVLSVLAAIAAGFAGIGGGSLAHDVVADLDAPIDAERRAGRFEAALALAVQRDSVLRQVRAPAWRRTGSHRELESLRKLTAMPEAERLRWRRSARTCSGTFSDAELNAPETRAALEYWAEQCGRWLGVDSAEHATALAELAAYHEQRNEPLRARELDERALRIRERVFGPRHPAVAASLDRLGLDIKMISGARETAIDLCERALAMRRELLGDDSREVAESLLRRANYRRTRQEMPAALADFARAESIFRAVDGDTSRGVAEVLTDRGVTLGTQERWDEAEPVLRRAVAIREALGGPEDALLVLALVQHGVALRELGRAEEAERVLRQAAKVQEVRWRAARPDRNRAKLLVLTAYRELALLEVQRGRWTAAWEDIERFSSRVAVDAAVARGEVDAAGDPWAGLLARVQRVLPDSTAMVGWVDSRYGGRVPDWPFWCFVVRKTGEPTWIRVVAPAANQEPLLNEVWRFIAAMHAEADWPLRIESSPELERRGREMYRLRFATLEPALAGVHSLVFASPDMNYCSPVEAMIDDHGRYVAERFVTLYTPSALLYAIAHERRREPADRRRWQALLVGAPASDRRSAWDSLPPLRNAAREIGTIAAMLPGADVLVGKRAAETAIETLRASGRLARYDMIHFATHADVGRFPTEERSALLLAEARPEPVRGEEERAARSDDGWLTASEIAGSWRLGAELVSLAACHGTSQGFSFATGPTGIGAACLDAGARSVLLSPYAIDDAASSLFFQHYASLLLAGGGRAIDSAAAVRAARLRLRDHRAADGTYPYRSPAFWAAFVLMGWPD